MHVKITIIISKEPRYKSHDTDYSAITAPRFYPLSIEGFSPQSCFVANWDTCYYCGFYYCKQQRRNGVIPSNGLLLTKPG